jgi:hypothetical protein
MVEVTAPALSHVVSCREGSKDMLRHVADTWALRPPQKVLSHGRTGPSAFTILAEQESSDACPASKARSGLGSFGNATWVRASPPLRGDGKSKQLTHHAARVAGLGRIYFALQVSSGLPAITLSGQAAACIFVFCSPIVRITEYSRKIG